MYLCLDPFKLACNHEESNHVALFKTMRSVYVYYQQFSVGKPDYNLSSPKYTLRFKGLYK